MITELKVRKTSIATILTIIEPDSTVLVEDQIDNVLMWQGSAARIIVHTDLKLPQNRGIRPVFNTKRSLPLRDALANYVVQIPGMEVFAIAAPDVRITPDIIKCVEHAESQRMERAWACYSHSNLITIAPKVFVMTAPVLPHVLRDMPPTLNFSSDTWAEWLHDWLTRFMLTHRYFSANSFGFVYTPTKPVLSHSEAIQEPVAISTSAVEQKPVKKKGRPKKTQ